MSNPNLSKLESKIQRIAKIEPGFNFGKGHAPSERTCDQVLMLARILDKHDFSPLGATPGEDGGLCLMGRHSVCESYTFQCEINEDIVEYLELNFDDDEILCKESGQVTPVEVWSTIMESMLKDLGARFAIEENDSTVGMAQRQ